MSIVNHVYVIIVRDVFDDIDTGFYYELFIFRCMI